METVAQRHGQESFSPDLYNGERQVSMSVTGIRRDHVARYEWARDWIVGGNQRVLDVACGVGYGSWIMAQCGVKVTGYDKSLDALKYAGIFYSHERVDYVHADLEQPPKFPAAHAAVCFETIEHLKDPLPLLRALADAAPYLLASVPNETVFPHQGRVLHHFRHYTVGQFEALLQSAGYKVIQWFHQEGPESEVEPGGVGRTTIVMAKRVFSKQDDTKAGDTETKVPPTEIEQIPDRLLRNGAPERSASPVTPVGGGGGGGAEGVLAWHVVDLPPTGEPWRIAPVEKVPEHVAIVGLGPTRKEFIDMASTLGGASALCDEVWGINAIGDVIDCDRIFHMDDVRIQELRAAARPDGNIAAMLKWLKTHPGPIYTSVVREGYPGLVAYPLEAVLNGREGGMGGVPYFTSTAAYAIAYAIHLGVKKISVFGLDFTMPNSHQAETGRACCEFWLGLATAAGIEIFLPSRTSMLGVCEGDAGRLYGYDCVDVALHDQEDGSVKVSVSPKAKIPTAEEIEKRYDHKNHPNPLMRK